MELLREVMLDRFRAKDAAYLGRFVTGVLTTGIYCLPTCPARKPLAKNVRFFDAPEEARRAGLRACKRCKPDDWYARRDPDREALKALVARMRATPGDFANAGSLARASGFGATKLGALCRRHYHVTPRQLLARARVARACEELLSTRRRALDVALECGFESTSSFHANFRREIGLAPGDYRRMARSGGFVLKLPARYPIDATLESLGRDHDGRTERVRGSRVARALRIEGRGAVLSIELRPGAARCHVTSSRPVEARGMAAAHAAALRLLGLGTDPAPFERQVGRQVGRSKKLAALVRKRRGLRIPQTTDVYEGLTWTIVGQQVNLAFAYFCRNGLVDLVGKRVDGLRTHPTPADVAKLDYGDLTKLKFSRRKAEYLVDLSRAIVDRRIDVEGLADGTATEAEATLLDVRGLGRWSAHYVLMRSCGFADCVPVGDAGLVRSLQELYDLDERPDPEETLRLMEPFAPYRSLATFHLWKRLGDAA